MSFEGFILLALFAVAGWPVARLIRGLDSGWRRSLAACVALSAWASLIWMVMERPERGPEKAREAIREHLPTTGPTQGYVTSENCRSCHPGHYASWHASYHRTMTTAASPETVKGDFGNVVYEHEGKVFQMTTRDGGFWMELDDPDREGDVSGERTRVSRSIDLVTGSHHLQFYWNATGNTRQMRMLPIVYNLHDRRWVPFPATLIRPPGSDDSQRAGMWNEVCIECHVTFAQPKVMSSLEVFSEAAEFGISCEACHGPAEEHVQVNESMLERYRRRLAGESDASVVEPTKLPSGLDSQVCGQCHSVARAASRAIYDSFLRRGYQYRPGGQVEPERVFARLSRTNYIREVLKSDPGYVRDFFWSDGMVRVAGREYSGLIESPCYEHDDDSRRLSCFSCHQLHKADNDPRPVKEWANDQLKGSVLGDRACLQCHEDYGNDIAAHTHHAADSSGSRCYNCHMPYTTYGLLKGIRSHQVSSPSVSESLEVGRPNACNLCHLDKTLAWTAKHLEERHGIRSPELGADDRGIAASLQWLIKGDAAQRALAAWHFGWGPARETSGEDWMPPFLAFVLDDDYYAVRYIASKSLGRLKGFGNWDYDYVGPRSERLDSQVRAMELWRSGDGATRADQELLLKGGGNLDEEAVRLLLLKRDNTPINMAE